MKNNWEIQEEVKKEARTGFIMQFTGMLSALIPVLGILGISLDWFNQEFIDNLYLFLVALSTLVFNLYTIYKNHFSREKSQEQNRVLKEKGLK